MTNREYRLKVHTLFFLFFFFFFAYYVVLLLTVYWKADLALFRRSDLEKDKTKEQIWPGAVRRKIERQLNGNERKQRRTATGEPAFSEVMQSMSRHVILPHAFGKEGEGGNSSMLSAIFCN